MGLFDTFMGGLSDVINPNYAQQLNQKRMLNQRQAYDQQVLNEQRAFDQGQTNARQKVYTDLIGNVATPGNINSSANPALNMQPIMENPNDSAATWIDNPDFIPAKEAKGLLGGEFDREGLFLRALGKAQTPEGFDLASKGYLDPNKGQAKNTPTTLMKNLAAAGYQQGTPKYSNAINKYLNKSGVTVNTSDEAFGLKDRFQGENTLRKGYDAQSKPFTDMERSFNRIYNSDSNGVGDMSLMFAYMKLLDPASTVREGEIATLENAGGVPNAIISAYNKAKGTGKISDKMRKMIKAQSRKFYDAEYSKQKDRYDNAASTANKYGLDSVNITGKMPAYMELKKQEEASQVEKPLNEWTDEELSAGKLLGGG